MFRRGTSDGDSAGMPSDPVGADWTTLPGNFKRNGYFTTGTGKTFREQLSPAASSCGPLSYCAI